MKIISFLLCFAALIIMFGCTQTTTNDSNSFVENVVETTADFPGECYDINTECEEVIPEYSPELGVEDEIKTLPDGTKYIVHPDMILSGGPPKDGIPPIDNPKYVTVAEADEWIADDELVMFIQYGGISRIYPLQIMVWHEIVNDTISGDPVLITWCPLCGSAIAYERKINGEEVEFGTSGKLYNSNLIMYDRLTDTYWSQIGGKAILGQLTGMQLNPLPIATVVWRDLKVAHPGAQVLSQDTGHIRSYGTDPYGSYYEDSFVFFPVENESGDERIHPKTVIYGVDIFDEFKAYKEDDLKELGKISDTFNGAELEIEIDDLGVVTISNKTLGSTIVAERDFWFAWYAFHPDTLVYGLEELVR